MALPGGRDNSVQFLRLEQFLRHAHCHADSDEVKKGTVLVLGELLTENDGSLGGCRSM